MNDFLKQRAVDMKESSFKSSEKKNIYIRIIIMEILSVSVYVEKKLQKLGF